MSRKHLFIFFLFFCSYGVNSQYFYRIERNKLFLYDLNASCEGREEFDFTNSDDHTGSYENIRFHPDGHMYIKASSDDANLYRYHPVRKEITKIELKTPQNTSQMAISEEGRFILSSRNSDSSEIYDYNLRQNKINRIFDARTRSEERRVGKESIKKGNRA